MLFVEKVLIKVVILFIFSWDSGRITFVVEDCFVTRAIVQFHCAILATDLIKIHSVLTSFMKCLNKRGTLCFTYTLKMIFLVMLCYGIYFCDKIRTRSHGHVCNVVWQMGRHHVNNKQGHWDLIIYNKNINYCVIMIFRLGLIVTFLELKLPKPWYYQLSDVTCACIVQ